MGRDSNLYKNEILEVQSKAFGIMKKNPLRNGEEIKSYPNWAANFIRNSLIYDTYNGHCLDSKRLKACTKMSLGAYFQLLRTILFDENGKPRFKKWNIWNLDETKNQSRERL